ncbi:hypothetical protein D3C76_1759330 [compost metagenome]
MKADGLLGDLPPPPSVKEALDDLPKINPGEDGGNLGYRSEAVSNYQLFMRGEINAAQYISKFTR